MRTPNGANTIAEMSRRTFLAAAGTAVASLQLDGSPADQVLTNSAWAKPVTAKYEPGAQGSGADADKSGRKGGGRTPSAAKGTVVWESAQPILEARGKPLPDALKDHYVLSLSGIADANSKPDLDQLKQFTTLQPKDQAVQQPDVVLAMEGVPDGVLFGFSKEELELTAADPEVQFTTWIGHLLVKTVFQTKDMVYKGKLAL